MPNWSSCGRVLYTHLLVLDTLLSSPDRWVLDLHIPIAGQLRVLLCDAEMPVLLIYARERGTGNFVAWVSCSLT